MESAITPDTLFRKMKPEWIRRFALRDALLSWVREFTGLATFYPDELDVCSTPRTLARHLGMRVALGHEQAIRKPVIPFREDPVCESTVFILSCPRSGSTLLRCMLMGHPMICAPPEFHLAQFRTMRERERAIVDSGRYWMTMGVAQTISQLTGWSERQAFHYVSHLTKRDIPVKEVYRLIHQLSPKPILVDKSPSLARDIAALQRLEQTFEHPRYLFLTRHPIAAIGSMMRVDTYPPWPRHTFSKAEQHWQGTNANVVKFLQNVPETRWYRLSFEDLMADTETVLRQIADFLGVTYSPEMADPYDGDRMRSGIGCVNLPKRQAVEKELGEKWKHVKLPRKLGLETWALAKRLGYELPRSEGTSS